MPESQLIENKGSWRDFKYNHAIFGLSKLGKQDEKLIATICGFANAQGGVLYIGKRDDGAVCGVADSKKLMDDLPNKIRDALGIIAEVNLIKNDSVEVIKITIPPYTVPISCRGAYYIRSGATNQKLTGLELEHFIMRKRGAT